jgi:hypothetical protein
MEIPLANGRGVAIVDDEDYELAAGRAWYAHSRGYAQTWRLKSDPREWPSMVYLHRLILGIAGDGHRVVADHINGDKLDNRRANLRVTTQALNLANRHGLGKRNTSGFHGVNWDEFTGKWLARAQVNYRQYNLGRFSTPEDAARARWDWIVAHNLQDFYTRHGLEGAC